ncbi:YesL family protein [Alteribacter natronophilus]|uniref:YesL family protein n=1 Tax=Alteribacter natronophilus TaxID=2583810 RepID=UPI00110D9D2C|nr:DUF624 domain-containing protein [Alteribacter natronophilus]TMW72280.1 DUF624 domain-containing protein [Alteribacter natronophilus]
MEQQGLLGGFNKFFEWFMNLAYLNILWLLFSLGGLVILGIAPATSALFSVVRQLLMEKGKVPVTKTYWHYYRKDFLKSNGLFYLFAAAAGIIAADLYFLSGFNHTLAFVTMAVLAVIGMVLLLGFIMLFPTFAHYELSFWRYIKHAVVIGLFRPLHIVLMVGTLVMMYYFMLFVPVLLLFFGMSLFALIVMSISYHIFNKIEQKSVAPAEG